MSASFDNYRAGWERAFGKTSKRICRGLFEDIASYFQRLVNQQVDLTGEKPQHIALRESEWLELRRRGYELATFLSRPPPIDEASREPFQFYGVRVEVKP